MRLGVQGHPQLCTEFMVSLSYEPLGAEEAGTQKAALRDQTDHNCLRLLPTQVGAALGNLVAGRGSDLPETPDSRPHQRWCYCLVENVNLP